MDDGYWCECGAASNDPLHDGWHKLWSWNRHQLARKHAAAEKAFDELLGVHDYRHGRTPEDPQQALDVSDAEMAFRFEGR